MYISIKRHSWFFKSWWCLLYFGHVQTRTTGKCWRQKMPFCLKLSAHAQWRQKPPFCLKLSTHGQKSVLSWSISMSRILGYTFIFKQWKRTTHDLMAHNWQKWKRVFLTCPCHKIYRDEAVVLKVANILEKLRFLWKCEIWGNIVKIWYFVNNCFIEAQI